MNIQIIEIEKVAELQGHKDAIYILSEGEEPGIIFSCGGDGLVVKWEVNHPAKPGKVVARLPAAVYSMIYLPEKNQMICGNRFGGIHLLDLKQQKQDNFIEVQGSVFDMKFLPGKNILIAGTGEGFLYFIEIGTFKIIKSIKISDKSCRSISLSTNKNLAATGWSDNFIRIIDLEKMEVSESWEAHENSVFALAYDKNKNINLISGGRDAQLKIWNFDEGKHELFMKIPAHLYTINDIVFNPQGNLFATASRDKFVKIWDAKGFELLKVIDKTKFEGHKHSVNKLMWSKDGNVLISAGDDRKIMIWQIKVADENEG